jgi:hypothetical protein
MIMKKPTQWKEVWIARTSTGMFVGNNGDVMRIRDAKFFETKEQLDAWAASQQLQFVMPEITTIPV